MSLPDCKTKNDCKGVVGPTLSDANLVAKKETPKSFECVIAKDPTCNPAAFTNRLNDNAYANAIVNESLNIAGADVLVFKMLGVHEQCKLVDVTGQGHAISSGDTPGFVSDYAFDAFLSEWHSVQRGDNVVSSCFIGYDFGEFKTNTGTPVYSTNANVRKHITAFAIKQSSNSKNRVTRVRLERSDDGIKWFGVEAMDLPDNDCFNTVMVKSSAPMRYWRLRPLAFNGGPLDYWGVVSIAMYHNYQATAVNNIQDKIFMENRDRDYSSEPILLKGSYDPQDQMTELSKFGIDLPNQVYTIKLAFASCVAAMGRPIIIGDVINLPSEVQYSVTMEPIPKWLEVTDVNWAADGFTAVWKHTLLSVTAQPVYASQEMQDIFGDLAPETDDMGLMDKDDGNNKLWQDYSDISQTILAHAQDRVPERGATVSSAIRKFSEEEIAAAAAQGLPNLQKIGQHSTGLYVEDGLPPNGAPYTTGDSLPEHPSDGEYHRLTYSNLPDKYPARLYRYSAAKNQWIYLETDRREQYTLTKELISEFKMNPNAQNNAKITTKRKDLDDCP